MSRGGPRRLFALTAVLATMALVGGIVLVAGGDGSRPEPVPTPAASSPPAGVEQVAFRMRLGRVAVVPVTDRVRLRRLAAPAESVRRTLASFYDAAFVHPDPRGGYADIAGHFTPEVREEVRRDLADLTLGKTAAHLTGTRWARGRVEARFLTGGQRQPVLAHAEVSVKLLALAGETEVPVVHRGDYVLRRTDEGWRIASYDVEGSVPRPRELRRTMRAELEPAIPSRDVLFILAIGSDARPGRPPAHALADSLHIIGVSPRTSSASIVGIPRDSYVPIPGVGTRKINESLFYGGPQLVVETVRRLTGVPIDAYLLTGFEGFKRMVGSIGGIEVDVPYAMSDPYSGARFRPGPARLRGRAALAFTRNRHDAPGGDFGRSMNQGRFLLAALREFRADLERDPLTLLRWLAAGGRFLESDLTLEEMAGLLMAVPSIERTRNVVVAGSGAMVGGASVVRLGSAAEAVFRDLRRDGVLGRR